MMTSLATIGVARFLVERRFIMERRNGSDLQSSIERVVDKTARHMEALGYSRQYLRLCRGIWRDLAKFSLHESVVDRNSRGKLRW